MTKQRRTPVDPGTLSPAAAWELKLLSDREILRRWPTDPDRLALAAPRLVDTTAYESLIDAIRHLASDDVLEHAGLAYALGYAALAEGQADAGIVWLLRAQARLQIDDWLLAGRVSFEIGAAYLSRGAASPADVLLLEAGVDPKHVTGDQLHLRALADEAMGDYRRATELYREVLRGNAPSLSPATRVLAMINLAAASNQRDPAESLALSELAINMISARDLHRRMRPAALNVMGYAQICLGNFTDARATLARARGEARDCGYTRIELYADFNEAIVDELSNCHADAIRRLLDVRDRADTAYPDLAGWAQVRLAWLGSMTGEPAPPASTVSTPRAAQSMRYADALRCIVAFDDSRRGRSAQALLELEACVQSAAARGDAASEFALLLQLAHVERSEGREPNAKRHVGRALAILEASTFRLSANWWSADAFDSFVELAHDPSTMNLIPPPRPEVRPTNWPNVQIRRDGSLVMNGAAFSPSWATGRTGSKMLRRLFTKLIAQYPTPLARDLLADELWPQSDGDAAIRNLYGATNDLRKILADIPGVRVRVDSGCYGLVFDRNVRLVDSPSPVTF